MVAYTDDTFVARKQKHQLSNQIEHDKKHTEKAERNDKNYEKKIYELGDLNVRRGLSGDIAVYNFEDNFGNGLVKKKWQVSLDWKLCRLCYLDLSTRHEGQ